MASRVLTIMITDIAGFTERTAGTSRQDIRKLLDEHETLLLPLVAKFQGTLVKTMGDSFLVAFESPTNAVLCAVMIQERLRAHNEQREKSEQMRVRIAINAGEVEIREGDVFGDAVNVAARIEGITDPLEIYFTEAVYLSMKKSEVPSSEIGQRRFRGVPEAVKLYKVIQDRDSEKYQELINRLKGTSFANGASGAPALGAAPAARRAWLRPAVYGLPVAAAVVLAVLAVPFIGRQRVSRRKRKVLETLRGGDLALALARADRMMERYPEEKKSHEAAYAVMKAEVTALTAEGKHAEALSLTEARSKERPYLKTAALRKEVMIERAAIFLGKGNYAASRPIYSTLIKDYPKDLDVLMEVVRKLGADYEKGATGLGEHAAFLLAENTEGPLDDLVGRTLVDSVLGRGPYGDHAEKLRSILAARYPPVFPAMQESIRSKKLDARTNAYLLLKAAARLAPDEELRYHVGNLVSIRSTYRKTGQTSVAYLTTACKAPDWEERKKAVGIGPIDDVAVLHSWSDYQREVSKVLVDAFLPETKASLLKWLDGDDSYLRVNAREMLRMAGLGDKVDEWAFHSKTLVNFGVTFTPRHFCEALDFFRQQAGTDRAEDARKALEAGKAYLSAKIEAFAEEGREYLTQQPKKNLVMVEEALAALGEEE